MKIVKTLTALLLLLSHAAATAQADEGSLPAPDGKRITIEECYEYARANYPLVKQRDLIDRSAQYDLRNASKAYLPQFAIGARATYQTDVTRIPISMPGLDIPELNKDQYQFTAEVQQIIWDGGATSARRQVVEADAEAKRMQYEVDMYAIRERVNGLYFGILLLEEQLALNDIYTAELQRNYDKVASYVENGVANSADLDAVKAEQVTARQQKVELETMREAYITMLGALTGVSLDGRTAFETPAASMPAEGDNNRPELALLDAQSEMLMAQRKGVGAKNMPMLGLFVQGGYGNPGLNMFREGFRTYAIGGVTLSWKFGNLYTRRNEIRNIKNNISQIETRRETFLFNTSLQSTQQRGEIEKYDSMMREDDELITLRENIRRASEAKVENGTMSVNDLMRDIHAEQSARQSRTLHRIEMLKSIYELRNLQNN